MRSPNRDFREPRNTFTARSSRSDEVRERRGQRTQRRAGTAAARTANPPAQRPVMVRGVLNQNAQPLYRQAARSNPRRTFYVAMDPAAGTEIRLPAIPLVRPGWRAISALIAVVALFAIFSVWNSPFFRVQQISIVGLQRVNAADLEAVIHLQNLSIIEVRPEQVKEEIAVAFPELADVQVQVELPNFVTVSARERQPVLAWQKGDSTYWVDPEGFIFPARGEAGPAVTVVSPDDIPAVQSQAAPAPDAEANPAAQPTAQPAVSGLLAGMGYTTPAYANRRADLKVMSATLQLVKLLPPGTQLVYDKENGLGWTDAGGWQVFIGKDLENFEAKLATYQAILSDLQNRGLQPDLISVEHLNAPFFRSRQMEEQAAQAEDGQ